VKKTTGLTFAMAALTLAAHQGAVAAPGETQLVSRPAFSLQTGHTRQLRQLSPGVERQRTLCRVYLRFQ
jgi:hypothetical protein